MFEAQILLSKDDTPTEAFSPWMGRRGDNVIATLDVAAGQFGDPEALLEVKVFHKNSEDTGDGVAVGSSIMSSAVGRQQVMIAGLKELVRYKFEFSVPSGGVTDNRLVQFRMLSPVWFDSVRPST